MKRRECRLISEAHDAPGTTEDYIDVYACDVAGNRITKQSDTTTPGIPDFLGTNHTFNPDQTITYTYGQNNALTEQTAKIVRQGLTDQGALKERTD